MTRRIRNATHIESGHVCSQYYRWTLNIWFDSPICIPPASRSLFGTASGFGWGQVRYKFGRVAMPRTAYFEHHFDSRAVDRPISDFLQLSSK